MPHLFTFVRSKFLALALAAVLSGCAYTPWHPFGTPITSEKVAQERVVVAERAALGSAQELVHKFNYAIEQVRLGNVLAVDVASAQAREAEQLLDQALGAPLVGDEAKWRDLVIRLVSDNSKIRTDAQAEDAKNFSRLAKLSTALDERSRDLSAAEKRVTEYAAEKEKIADRYNKVLWVVGGLFLLYFLGQILAMLAHFNPAFEAASNTVNAIISPALHSIAAKAKRAVASAVT